MTSKTPLGQGVEEAIRFVDEALTKARCISLQPREAIIIVGAVATWTLKVFERFIKHQRGLG